MSSSFEKSVKGATKIKAAPPKSKYIEHILIATHSGEHGVADVFKYLQHRLRDSTWTVVFKSLITIHMMIREGSPDVTLAYLSRHRNMLAISSFSDVQTQGRNIRHYVNYLTERARAYRETKCDFVKAADHRLEKMTVEKGLLRETETVQHQITALLKCDILDNEAENEITITVFRMLVLDLLAMFNVMNQAMINILGHFFEMSRPDAERSMEIYRNFTKQTDFVVAYLSTARQYEHQTRVEVPKLKHAPVNLGKQLEDYLMDPDFEINRRQYLAEQEGKKGRGTNGASKTFAPSAKPEADSRVATGKAFPDAQFSGQASAQPVKPPAPAGDLIDFFGSIETPTPVQPAQQQQQTGYNPFQQMQSPNGQQNGFNPQPSPYQNGSQFQQQQQQQQQQQSFNPGFQQPQPLQPNFTGAGFGGYTPQPSFQPGGLSSIPQDQAASFQQQQSPQMLAPMQTGAQTTNPFRQSMLPNPTGMPQSMNQNSFTGAPPVASPMQQQSTNPFAKSRSPPVTQAQSTPLPQTEFQRPMTTGTNPFARNMSMSAATQRPNFEPQRTMTMGSATTLPSFDPRPQTAGTLMPQATGTNPFRQSQFVNTATGQGWQNSQRPIGGGLDSMPTVPVFPRPAQQQPWGQ